MAKSTNEIKGKKTNKYVSTIGVKRGKHESKEENEDIFNFNNETIIGVNNNKKETNQQQATKPKSNKQSKVNKDKKQKNKQRNNQKNKKRNNQPIKQKQTKQQIQKTLKELEQEQKAKQKRIKVFKRVKIFILILAIFTAIILFLLSPVFKVKQINVTGNSKIATEQIVSMSGINLEENTFKINTIKSEKQIKENAYIKTVKINRNLPSGITIEVEERVATFMIEYGGSYVYINNQGYILEISNAKIEAPTLIGTVTQETDFEAGNRLCTEDLEKLSTVLKIVESANSNNLLNQVDKIDISDNNDYKIIFETDPKTAHIGDASSIGIRILNIKALREDNKDLAGEIFVNMDLNKDNPYFRKQV